MATITLPGITEELLRKFQDFLSDEKTGNITFNVKDGRILSWQFTEFGRPCITQPALLEPPQRQRTGRVGSSSKRPDLLLAE